MKMQAYLKQLGMLKLCELCNWDLADIRLHLYRETDIDKGTQLSRAMAEFKSFVKDYLNISLKDRKRIEELLIKLRGEK